MTLDKLVASALVAPASVRVQPLQGLVYRDLADIGTIDLALAWRRNVDSPVVDAVITVLASAFAAAGVAELL